MKHKNILKNIHIALGFMLLSLSSCEHKPLETDEYTDLRITVRDAGYINADNGSRATDNGFTTTFEEGDKIGIYVVDQEGTVLRSNVLFTLSGGSNWFTTEEPIRVKEFPVKIVAYYPYVEDTELEDKITSTAETASEFFATYINDLNITDQSTEELYRKADVMAYMKSFSTKEDWLGTLELSLEHLMGLAVVKLPETVVIDQFKYYMKGNESYKWTADNVEMPAEFTANNLPENVYLGRETDNFAFKYLVKPGETFTASGSFTCYDNTKNYTISGKTVSSGKYKQFNIESTILKGPEEEIPHVLKIGDYFMESGALLDEVPAGEVANCMGVVYYVGNTGVAGKSLGLIVGLNEIYSTQWGTYGEASGVSTDQTKFNGYENTIYLTSNKSDYAIVKSYNTLKGQEASETNNKTSGWYIPSVAEMKVFVSAYATVNGQLGKIKKTQLSASGYWSSTEHSSSGAHFVVLDSGVVGSFNKGDDRRLRLVCAF